MGVFDLLAWALRGPLLEQRQAQEAEHSVRLLLVTSGCLEEPAAAMSLNARCLHLL